MTEIRVLQTEYIRNNRTIDTVELENDFGKGIVYVYNYQGIHYRFFKDIMSLLSFLQKGIEPEYNFETESELDEFLLRYRF